MTKSPIELSPSAPACVMVPCERAVRPGCLPLAQDRGALIGDDRAWSLVLDVHTRWWGFEENHLGTSPRVGLLRHALHPAIDAFKLNRLLQADLASRMREIADGYDSVGYGFSPKTLGLWNEVAKELASESLLLPACTWTDVREWNWKSMLDAFELDPWSTAEEASAALTECAERYQTALKRVGETAKTVVGKGLATQALMDLRSEAHRELSAMAFESTEEPFVEHGGVFAFVLEDQAAELESKPHPCVDAFHLVVGGDVRQWFFRALEDEEARRKPQTRNRCAKSA